jgi:hypothetical protein
LIHKHLVKSPSELQSRQANKRLVSVADTVRAVKTVAPWCNLNDADLKEIVAQRAIFRRLNIAFDLTEYGIKPFEAR